MRKVIEMGESDSDCVEIENGTIRDADGTRMIFFNGYWIRYYTPPAETLTAKKNLIDNLTRRTFHHTEPGINTPGENLELARSMCEQSESEAEARVYSAMLAGALFNRATDIFRTIVDLESKGVHISSNNELMKECSDCLQEAMELGKSVRHFSGNEGIDELWGEPLKAFTMSIKEFHRSRYIKISMTMRDIDRICSELKQTLASFIIFDDVWPVLREFAHFAKQNCETIKTDHVYFTIWPKFITRSEKIGELIDAISQSQSPFGSSRILQGCKLIETARDLMIYISGARVPMPDTTARFLEQCSEFSEHNS